MVLAASAAGYTASSRLWWRDVSGLALAYALVSLVLIAVAWRAAAWHLKGPARRAPMAAASLLAGAGIGLHLELCTPVALFPALGLGITIIASGLSLSWRLATLLGLLVGTRLGLAVGALLLDEAWSAWTVLVPPLFGTAAAAAIAARRKALGMALAALAPCFGCSLSAWLLPGPGFDPGHGEQWVRARRVVEGELEPWLTRLLAELATTPWDPQLQWRSAEARAPFERALGGPQVWESGIRRTAFPVPAAASLPAPACVSEVRIAFLHWAPGAKHDPYDDVSRHRLTWRRDGALGSHSSDEGEMPFVREQWFEPHANRVWYEAVVPEVVVHAWLEGRGGTPFYVLVVAHVPPSDPPIDRWLGPR